MLFGPRKEIDKIPGLDERVKALFELRIPDLIPIARPFSGGTESHFIKAWNQVYLGKTRERKFSSLWSSLVSWKRIKWGLFVFRRRWMWRIFQEGLHPLTFQDIARKKKVGGGAGVGERKMSFGWLGGKRGVEVEGEEVLWVGVYITG